MPPVKMLSRVATEAMEFNLRSVKSLALHDEGIMVTPPTKTTCTAAKAVVAAKTSTGLPCTMTVIMSENKQLIAVITNSLAIMLWTK